MMNWRKRLGLAVEPMGQPYPNPVFVVGCMRSGTTFLVDKLTTHPQLLKVGNELRQVWGEWGNAPCGETGCHYRDASHADAQAALNMSRYFLDYIRQSRSPQRYLMRARYRQRTGAGAIHYDWASVRPVNKSTHLVNKIEYVNQLFPQAHWVLIVRDLYGQVASMKSFIQGRFVPQGQSFYSPPDPRECWQILPTKALDEAQRNRSYPDQIEMLADMWLRLNALAFRALGTIPEERVSVISYEELVQKQPEVLGGVFQRLALDPKYQSRAAAIAQRQVLPYNTATQGNPLEKWKKHLDEEDQARIAALLESHGEKYEYIRTSLLTMKIAR